MSRHEQLKVYPLELSNLRRIRFDHHPIPDFHPTGCTGFEFAFDFNKAKSARPCGILHFFEVTQVGDVDIVFETYLKKAAPLLCLNLLSVDNNRDH
jgi:hypothetical protein